MFGSRENFCFTFLYGIMTSKKTWMQTTKWSTCSKIPDFQNGEKSPRNPNLESAKVGAKVKFLQFIYLWEKNVVKINIVFRTRVQKWTYCKIFSNGLGQSHFTLLLEAARGTVINNNSQKTVKI